MKRILFTLLAALILAVAATPATAQTKKNFSTEFEPYQSGGWPPAYATSWPGTDYTLPFGTDRTAQEVLSWALQMPAVQSAMAEAQTHGAVRRPDSDAAYTLAGYSCAVIGFEYPGVSIDSVQPIINIVTKVLPENGHACTNIFGGAYKKTIVNGQEVPTFCDDIPGAFQIAVLWTAVPEGATAPVEAPAMVEGEEWLDEIMAFIETSEANNRYWASQIFNDRNVGTAFVNTVVTAACEGALAGGMLSVRSGNLAATLPGIGLGAMAGVAFAALQFLNQPAPKPKVPMPMASVSPQTGAAQKVILGARRPSWGQLKAAYR